MRVNTFEQNTIGLNALTKDQLRLIHFSTLDILERVGVDVFEKEALELLSGAGARVDKSRVKIPAWLVEKALASAPEQINLYTRQGLKALSLAKNNIYFGTGSETPFIIDLDTGLRRPPLKEDVKKAALLADALPHMDFVMSLALATDVPVEAADRHQFAEMTLNTTKPICFTAYNRENLKAMIEISRLATGGAKALRLRPNLIHYAEPNSPLMHSKEAVEKLFLCAEEGVPVIYAAVPMLGATGPVTMAGSLALANAENLSGLVMHQLKEKGAPFIYGGGIPAMDMMTSVCSYGSPERDLGCLALMRLAQFYKLPTFTTAGCTDAHLFDQQAGMEAGFNLLAAGLSGGNLIHDSGYMGVGMTCSLEYVLLCNETAGAVKFLLGGVEINEETLALEVIEKVGPGGNFLGEEHTLKNFLKVSYQSPVLGRDNYDSWQAKGAKTYQQRANLKVKEILQNHKALPLAPQVRQEIEALAAKGI